MFFLQNGWQRENYKRMMPALGKGLLLRGCRFCASNEMGHRTTMAMLKLQATLWLLTYPWKPWPIGIDGLPNSKMGGLSSSQTVSHNQRPPKLQWLIIPNSELIPGQIHKETTTKPSAKPVIFGFGTSLQHVFSGNFHVGETMENKPPMTGNGTHTTYVW